MLELCYFNSKAKHPNIVGIIDCQPIENNLAIVMELVNGGNLKEFLKKDLLTDGAEKKEFTVRFVEHIGSAIEHLHSLNIIHRDVKPDNILVSMRRRMCTRYHARTEQAATRELAEERTTLAALILTSCLS